MPDVDPKANIYALINAVRLEVKSVAKGDRYDAAGTKYAYRGVDRVVKALANSVRKHGIIITPQLQGHAKFRAAQTTQGKATNHASVTVKYTLTAPSGSTWVDVVVPGEAMDGGDKGVSKAMSVAWRTMLLQTFFLPTGDPDPDSENFEATVGRRGTDAPPVRARDYAAAAVYAEWESKVEKRKADFYALGELRKEALAAKAPRSVLDMISAAGNAVKPK